MVVDLPGLGITASGAASDLVGSATPDRRLRPASRPNKALKRTAATRIDLPGLGIAAVAVAAEV
jgi:hypothetical protein